MFDLGYLVFDADIVSATGISGFSVSLTNPRYAVYDGVLYSKDMKTLISCPTQKTGPLNIPDTVEYIADSACYLCSRLSGELILP